MINIQDIVKGLVNTARNAAKAPSKNPTISFNDNSIKALINSAGIYDRNQIDWYAKFNRFGFIDPYNSVSHTKEYVFFTKPDLHIFEKENQSVLNKELSNVAIFRDAFDRYRPVLRQMQSSIKGGSEQSPFINLLSNTIRSNIDLPGISAGETESAANIYGTRLMYRKESNLSDEAHDFSIEFEDTKYLEVYMYFKLFDEYERKKYFGEISPRHVDYIYRRILTDQISIYKFIVAEDGQSLLYWAKLYGCYPKTVPREAFSDLNAGGGLRFSVQWRAQFVEDMDPQILSDFNKLVTGLYKSTYTKDLELYNNTIEASDGTWAGIPYIAVPTAAQSQIIGKEMQYKYSLRWRV